MQVSVGLDITSPRCAICGHKKSSHNKLRCPDGTTAFEEIPGSQYAVTLTHEDQIGDRVARRIDVKDSRMFFPHGSQFYWGDDEQDSYRTAYAILHAVEGPDYANKHWSVFHTQVIEMAEENAEALAHFDTDDHSTGFANVEYEYGF